MAGLEVVFSTPWQLAATAAVLFVAQAVYVLLGFGAGLVAVGALALLLPDLRDGVVLLLLVNFPSELFVVVTSWRDIAWRGVIVLMFGVGVGIPIGAWLLAHTETGVLLLTLGAVLIALGSVFLLAPRDPVVRWPRWAVVPVGLSSGVLTGLFGTGGPPLVLYYRLAGVDKAGFRGNLMAVFLLMTLIRVPSYAGIGLITGERLLSGLLVMPAVIAGAWVGHRIQLSVGEQSFRRLVAAALVVLGVVLLAG